MRAHWLCVAVVGIGVHFPSASGAEVTFTLSTTYVTEDRGWFSLDVTVSPDDNGGLSGYDVSVLGVESAQVFVPAGTASGYPNFPVTGMTIGNWDAFSHGEKTSAGQNTNLPETLAYHLGQPGVDPTWPDPGFPVDNPNWRGHLASGTYSAAPTFGDDVNVTVFVEAGGVDTIGNISLPPSVFPPADFDLDEDVDTDDFLLWQSSFRGVDQDADGDGDSDYTDFLIWQAMYPTPFGDYDGGGLDGPVVVNLVEEIHYTADFDSDGDVDGDDFLIWQASFNGPDGDADRDGDTDGDDFLIWQQQFGFGVDDGGGSTSVPEPAAWLLAAIACGLIVARSGHPARRPRSMAS